MSKFSEKMNDSSNVFPLSNVPISNVEIFKRRYIPIIWFILAIANAVHITGVTCQLPFAYFKSLAEFVRIFVFVICFYVNVFYFRKRYPGL